ncbi:hypothetical protein [Pseudoclavibacter helvolus]|uniref:hypothetical protein n=1 Tax=Pseudoclavibacter helvolus TaxID=255205 RepID=UPI000838E266|nr:hypothetical protein [Pseudoclavibacter helvolus]
MTKPKTNPAEESEATFGTIRVDASELAELETDLALIGQLAETINVAGDLHVSITHIESSGESE